MRAVLAACRESTAVLAMPVLRAICALLAVSAAGAKADPAQVYDGMTPRQVADFAERQGWRADVSTTGASLTLHVDDKTIEVTLMDCDDGRCRSGILRDTSYYFVKSPGAACDFWHWNQATKGATGFGPNYVTLQRYIQFRGVTDQYLRDAIDAWVGAAPSFWKLAKECASNKPSDARKDPKP